MINNFTKNIIEFSTELSKKKVRYYKQGQRVYIQFFSEFDPTDAVVTFIKTECSTPFQSFSEEILNYNVYTYQGGFIIVLDFTIQSNYKTIGFLKLEYSYINTNFVIPSFNQATYYSNYIIFDNEYQSFTEVKWHNTFGIGKLIYPNQFYNLFNIDSYIETLSSEVENEFEENGLGESILVKSIIKQPYSLSFFCDEWQAQSLATLHLYSDVYINQKKVINVSVSKESNSDNSTALINIQFEYEQLLKLNCNTEEPILL